MMAAYKHLIKWGLRHHYTIEVVCAEEGCIDYSGKHYRSILDAVEALDACTVYFKDGDDYKAGFSVNFLVDLPEETVSDWGINEVSIAWDLEYVEHCKRYPINRHFSRSNN